jgi:predicted double-glycine peptidase
MSLARRCIVLALLAAVIGSPAVAQVRLGAEAAQATVRVLSWKEIPFRTVVRQQHDFSCGSAALATLLTYHYGRPTAERDAFSAMYAHGDRAKIRKVGFSMLDMKTYLASRGLRADGFRVSLDELRHNGAPVIALINLGAYRHFVVVKGVEGDKVLVGDPALGLRIFKAADFARMWNGIAFALHDNPSAGPPRFNVAQEWLPWAVAPVRNAAQLDTLTTLTRDQLPLFQISQIITIPTGVGP